MERDLHFYGMAVLARAAGFSERASLDMAYASQYVDDATEGDCIRVGDQLFDPVRTAHVGLRAYDWDVQKNVYIPFHFLPREAQNGPGDGFLTEPASPFANDVFQRACSEPKGAARHIAVGIALHTFADSFSHQGFSGRFHGENHVAAICHKKAGNWRRLLLENICLDFLPEIGHAEAGRYPDFPFLTWRAQRPQSPSPVERENSADFMKACKTIYDLLEQTVKPKAKGAPGWSGVKSDIETCLASTEEVDERCQTWEATFGHLFKNEPFIYSKTAWREEALNPPDPSDVDWDPSGRSQFARMNFPMTPGFWESRWVTFHRAALKQRHFVLERLL